MSHGHEGHGHGDEHEHEHDHKDEQHDDYHEDTHDDGGDEHSDEDHQEDEIQEEKEYKLLNDIQKIQKKDLKDLNMEIIYKLSPLRVYKKIFKGSTRDLSSDTGTDIQLSLFPKIKIISLKRAANTDIFYSKKGNTLCCKPKGNYKNTPHLLDVSNSDIPPQFYGPYPDIIKPKERFLKTIQKKIQPSHFKNIFKNKIKNIQIPKIQHISIGKKRNFFTLSKTTFIKGGVALFGVLIFIFGYTGFVKYNIEKTTYQVKNFSLQKDISVLKSEVLDMKTNILVTKTLLQPFFIINKIIQNDNITQSQYLIQGANHLVNFAVNSFIIYEGIEKILTKKAPNNIMYSELLKNIQPYIEKAKYDIDTSYSYFEKVKNFPNTSSKNDFKNKLTIIQQLKNYTQIITEHTHTITSLLGDEKKKNYMIVFQNNDEIRPLGGFMGSVGFIGVYKGKIMNFEKKDIYALEWELKDFATKNGVAFETPSPEGLNKLSPTFGLRDANYYPNIEESSLKIKSFLDKTSYQIDGIIYINQNIILDFLQHFGGIYFEPVKREITHENFSWIISTLVELKITKTHTLATPKQILFDFIDVYFQKIYDSKDYTKALKSIISSIEKKDMLFYSFSQNENEFLEKLGLKNTPNFKNYKDFFYPVYTSISGNKSDRYIQRSFIKNTTQLGDCSFQTRISSRLEHQFSLNNEIEIKNLLYDMDLLSGVDIDKTLQIQGKGQNKQYVRFFIPPNAQIKTSDTYTIENHPEFTQISFFQNTGLLLPSDFQIEYTLSNPNCEDYSFSFIKQPGIKSYLLHDTFQNQLLIDSFLQKDYLYPSNKK